MQLPFSPLNSDRTRPLLAGMSLLSFMLGAFGLSARSLDMGARSPSAQSPGQSPTSTASPGPPQTSGTTAPVVTPPAAAQIQQRPGLNIVVLDPAHGGTDTGARGMAGIRESEVVLDMTWTVRQALERQGFQVLQTRQGDQNPSFDDRSAIANAQRGAVFVSLHIASTGLPGTVRVYVNSDLPTTTDPGGLIPWDRAQAPFLTLSHKLGDLVQGQLAQRFRGSPPTAITAAVRQLRTTAAPAIAVEISSVTAEDRSQLEHMFAGVADAIAQGIAYFRPSYVVPRVPGTVGAQP
jgi:N-acetylmuramoyl-L-alanine amidase